MRKLNEAVKEFKQLRDEGKNPKLLYSQCNDSYYVALIYFRNHNSDWELIHE
jgi:hypothetical protein